MGGGRRISWYFGYIVHIGIPPPKSEVFTVQSFYKSSITAIWTPLNQVYSTPWNFPQTTNISKVCLLKCSWSVFTSFSWSYLSYPQKRPQRRAFLRESLVHLPVFQSLLCFFCSFGSCWGRLGPSTKTEKYEKSWDLRVPHFLRPHCWGWHWDVPLESNFKYIYTSLATLSFPNSHDFTQLFYKRWFQLQHISIHQTFLKFHHHPPHD